MASETLSYELPESAKAWASRYRQGLSPRKLRELLGEQKGLCALSGVVLVFDKEAGIARKGGPGVHPLGLERGRKQGKVHGTATSCC
jgi:hypothetical protein